MDKMHAVNVIGAPMLRKMKNPGLMKKNEGPVFPGESEACQRVKFFLECINISKRTKPYESHGEHDG